jgi:phage recombination protein Bet
VLFEDSSISDILFPMTPHNPSPLTPDQDSLLRRTITKNLSDDEHALFVQTCERSGLDPFARHIYPIKRKQWNSETRSQEWTYAAEATIDGLRLTAERTQRYGGQLGPEWCGKDGIWRDIWTSDEPPCGARVGIIRQDFDQPVWGKALYSEFVQLNNGEPTAFWVKMAANQLAKCAEALGFRKAFPRQFSGIYTGDEMAQASSFEAEKASPTVIATTVVPSASTSAGATFPPSVADSEHGRAVLQEPRPVPVQLRVFVDRGTGYRPNVVACFEFIRRELLFAGGSAQEFDRIKGRLPHTFRTKEAYRAATVDCWLDLWELVEVARKQVAA